MARAEVSAGSDGQSFTIVATRPVERIKGEPAADCPPKLGDLTLSGDGRTFTQRVGGEPDLTYRRPAATGD